MHGWPANKEKVDVKAKQYFKWRDELVIYEDILLKGDKIIIPYKLRRNMLSELHSSHIGLQGCLRRARESMFWPGMNADIRNTIETCNTC